MKVRLYQLGKDSVSQSWGVIAETHLLDGLPDPRKTIDEKSHTGLGRSLAHQIKIHTIEDPPVNQDKSSPLCIIHSILA